MTYSLARFAIPSYSGREPAALLGALGRAGWTLAALDALPDPALYALAAAVDPAGCAAVADASRRAREALAAEQ